MKYTISGDYSSKSTLTFHEENDVRIEVFAKNIYRSSVSTWYIKLFEIDKAQNDNIELMQYYSTIATLVMMILIMYCILQCLRYLIRKCI